MQNDLPSPIDDAHPATPLAVPPQQITRTTRFWGRFLGCLGVFMLIGVILTGIGGAIAFNLYRQPPVTSDSTQSFAVGNTPHLVVNASAGNVRFIAGVGNAVTVQTHKMARALTHDAAVKLLNDIHISITQTGDTITITDTTHDAWQFFGFSQREVDFTITLPAQSAIDATLSAGNQSVTGVTGQVNIQESAGNVQLQDVTLTGTSQVHERAGNITINGQLATGTMLDLENSAGDITFDGALATHNTLSVHESAGDVRLTLPQTTSAHLDARVSGGSIHINGWPISITSNGASASASGNTQQADSVPTNTITVENSAGDIIINAA